MIRGLLWTREDAKQSEYDLVPMAAAPIAGMSLMRMSTPILDTIAA